MAGRYHDRAEAGRVLAAALRDRSDLAGAMVLALPRGGAPVAASVAAALGATLDVALVRKLGAPGREELALGAIASGGALHRNERIIGALGVDEATLALVIEREREELRRRERAYRGDRPAFEVQGCTVVLVDDGLATGATMLAAAEAMRAAGAARIVVAVPVGSPEAVDKVASVTAVDEVVCPLQPTGFLGVGQWYDTFGQVTDDEVRAAIGAG
ncbi:MAG: phosphoribosyltransferase [Phycisphaerales bacterium]